MAASITFFNIESILGYLGNFHLGSNTDACAGHFISVMDKISPSCCHDVEFGNHNNCYTLCLELGFCPAFAGLDIHLCAGELEAKDASSDTICHRVVWNGTCANAGRQSKSIFLVGSPLAYWLGGTGHRLENKT